MGLARAWGLGSVVGVVTLGAMLATEPALAIVWDEGFTLGRLDRVRAWFTALRDPVGFADRWTPPDPDLELVQPDRDRRPPPRPDDLKTPEKLFAPKVVEWFWPFAREEPHGHPPFYALVGLVGDITAPWAEPLFRARLGTILLFSLTAGVVGGWFARRFGLWPSLAGSAAWILQPRLFAEGHYATYDAILASLWVLAILVFARAVRLGEDSPRRQPRWLVAGLLGLLLGCAAATKLTGWLIVLPCLAWATFFRDRRAFLTLIAALPIAALVLWALVPPWWSEPISGVARFLRSNTTRDQTINITVSFLGQRYATPSESLPWHNTLVWTVFVTPVLVMILALSGLVRVVRRDRLAALFALNWLFLVVLRALPNTPGHDGVRQFLPAFGMLALLAGVGAVTLGRWDKWFVGALVVEGVVGLAVMMPVPLAYYSPAVGGLPGAVRLGMEPTYYWDALDGEALDWLNANTPEGQTVAFATNPRSWLYLRSQGRLKAGFSPIDPGPPAWYVVQNRSGELLQPGFEMARALIARDRPAHVVSKLGVPLVWIFPMPNRPASP